MRFTNSVTDMYSQGTSIATDASTTSQSSYQISSISVLNGESNHITHPPVQKHTQNSYISRNIHHNNASPQYLSNDDEQFEELESELANTKEKTPMCLVNELARFHRTQHQYLLTDEQGPAHKKIFYVKLKLGEEEYCASGASIKKAQHAAAEIALRETQLKHPPPKTQKIISCHNTRYPESVTPTVLLNALVMKRGEPAVYRHMEVPRAAYCNRIPNLDFRGMYNHRYQYPNRYAKYCYVNLKVGPREFVGVGSTRQIARHNAAEKALNILKHLPLPEKQEALPSIEPVIDSSTASLDTNSSEDGLKSAISLVFEIALKRNFSVTFEILKESGPPHMRIFITQCKVDKYTSVGEGNSKKLSKKRAAEQMLEELKVLPPVELQIIKPKRMPVQRKKKRNLIKTTADTTCPRADPNYGVGVNPISRLIQIQQAKKEKEPVYTLTAERGVPRRREFVIQVQVGENVCTGVGPNKKLAKRNAAESMLQMLGYSRQPPQPTKPAIKSTNSDSIPSTDKKVTFIDQGLDANLNRQLVPGVLFMPDGNRGAGQAFLTINNNRNGNDSYKAPIAGQSSAKTTSVIAKELLEQGMSTTADAILKSRVMNSFTENKVMSRPKDKLLHLADVLGFHVQFTDFPKGNNKVEVLSLVSLSTNPQNQEQHHVSHGSGATIDDSHDNAALAALYNLSEMVIETNTDMIEKIKNGENHNSLIEKAADAPKCEP